MKTTTIIFNSIVFMAMNFTFLSVPILAEEKPDVNRGAQAWANNCSRCHNMRQPNEFADDIWEPTINHMRVRAGLPGDMARDIRAFLQASNFKAQKVAVSANPAGGGVTADSKSALSGNTVFDTTCIACHGANGKGTIPGIPTLQSRLSQSDEILLQHIKDGFQSEGSVMVMPPRGGNPALTDEEIKNVLMYMREQFGQ